ncbi:MAG: hypothetical protein ACLGPL_06800 [Acidobacteriota bacterium]
MTETWDVIIKLVPAAIGLGGALLGGAVVWGVAKAKIEHLEKSMAAAEAKIAKMEQTCLDAELRCRSVQSNCSGQVAQKFDDLSRRIHERMDEVVEKMSDLGKELSFISGTLKGQRG